MKKTVLILSILISGLSAKAQSQVNDARKLEQKNYNGVADTSSAEHPFYYLQFRTGMLGGFQVIKHDSAYVTLDMPFEVNIRRFAKSSSRHYQELSGGYDFFVLNQTVLITAWGIKYGYGMMTKEYNYNFQLHVGYMHGNGLEKYAKLKRYTHMLNVGYVFEASSIPVIIDLITPVESKLEVKWNIIQVGIKLPIWNTTLSKEN